MPRSQDSSVYESSKSSMPPSRRDSRSSQSGRSDSNVSVNMKPLGHQRTNPTYDTPLREVVEKKKEKNSGTKTLKIALGVVGLLALIFLILTIVFAVKAKKAAVSKPKPVSPTNPPATGSPPPTPTFQAANRVDCHPDPGTNPGDCASRKCHWDANAFPQCYFDNRYGYSLINSSNPSAGVSERILSKQSNWNSPFGGDIQLLKLRTENLAGTFRVKITDTTNSRYQVPVTLFPQSGRPNATNNGSSFTFRQQINANGAFSFQIIRTATGNILWDTSLSGLIFGDQYLQISTYLPSSNIYGFGENTHQTFRHDLSKYKSWPVFARDQAPWSESENFMNLYGVHPFYVCIEADGSAHGVLLMNSNAQEFVLGPRRTLTYRTIGGDFDFYFLPGPNPNDVIRQYWNLVGNPMMPAYWALGFQLCRYGYKGVADISAVINRTLAAKIPHDVQYADIDYMDKRRDFTYDPIIFKGFPSFVRQTKANLNLKWILILDPAINVAISNYTAFWDGLAQNVYVQWPNASVVQTSINNLYPSTKNTNIMLGTVWPDNNTAFPDWLSPNTSSWWQTEIVKFYQIVPYDGLWVDMNEPANFGTNDKDPWYWHDPTHFNAPQLMCPPSSYETPPYGTGAVYTWGRNAALSQKTICMIAQQGGKYMHYNVHSLYGLGEAQPSQLGIQKATGGRSAVIGRSTFPTAGQFEGHWLGDNYAMWPDMHTSIIGIMEFNMFGFPYVGADICGFHGNTTEELCLRWQQLGAFYPFSRNHNAIDSLNQDPGLWPTVAAAARQANNFRYTYLPYLYTLFYRAHTMGESLIRSQAFENPTDQVALTIDRQFLWGSSFMITPVLTKGALNVTGYFPAGMWYTISPLNYGTVIKGPTSVTLPAPLTSLIPVHAKAGAIIPRQAPALTTTEARKNPLQLLVTVGGGNSIGSLYWDDGNTIQPTANQTYFANFKFIPSTAPGGPNLLSVTLVTKGTALSAVPTIDIVEVLGHPNQPDFTSFQRNNTILTASSTYNSTIGQIYLTQKGLLDLSKCNVGHPLYITWNNAQ